LYFIARRKVKRAHKMQLFGLLALGGAQGLMGWYMVKSGLVDNPDVSHYRLAAHLSLALVILNVSLWIGLRLLRPWPAGDGAGLTRWAKVMLGLLYVQLFYGALTAGLNAGFSWNTWPLMDGALLPAGLSDLTPVWLNFVENPMAIQFLHRFGAYAVIILALLIVVRAGKRIAEPTVRRIAKALLHLTLLQVALGIWTLLAVVPVALGTLHQGVGVLVFIAGITLLYELREPSGLK
jgi:cytochrome c oxidase assembly protein subunit 15